MSEHRPISLLIAGVVLLLAPWPARAQQALMGPSVSMEDPSSVFANPAILSFQRARLALGAKAYHLGVGEAGGLPLRQGAFVLSSPFLIADRVGVGALVQYFDSPIYRRTSIGAGVSTRVFDFVSIGLHAAAYTLSYDASEFVDFDPADPVFAGGYGRTTLDASLGAFAQPFPALSLALGVRHVNRPDLSLVGDGVRLAAEPFVGAGYAIGPMRALIEFVDGPFGPETRWGVEAATLGGSYLRVSSDTEFDLARVEGLLHVGGPISVSYGYELPIGALGGASNGSHTFSLVYEFGRTPDLPDPVLPPAFLYTADLPAIDPVMTPRVYTSADSDYLRYFEHIIVRRIDDDVPEAALRTLRAADLGTLDSARVARRPRPEPSPIEDPNERVERTGTYSSQYEASLREAGRSIRRDDSLSIAVTAAPDAVLRALGVRNRLVEQGLPADRVMLALSPADSTLAPATSASFLPEERALVLEPEQTTLYFLGANREFPAADWQVRIEDAAGAPVKGFLGTGDVPDAIPWDWRTDAGEVIPPGVYRYRLYWTDTRGERHESNIRKLYVQKFLRKVTVTVTRDLTPLPSEADRIELRIQH
jgi:hypothetical protein